MTVALVDKIAWPVSSNYSIKPSVDTVGKGGYNLLATSDVDAVIKALFASGEQGAWFDPSDFSTMFQDSAGTTPVTAVGQPVGLILDKSKGLELGPETVVNGDFASGTTGWSNSGGTFTPAAGKLDVVNGSSWFWSTGGIALKPNATYQFNIDVSNYVSGSFQIYISDEVGHVSYAMQSNSHFTVYCRTGSVGGPDKGIIFNAFNGTIDNLSYKELAGNHATQATAAARPVLANNAQTKPFRDFDAVDDSMGTTFPSSLGSTCTVGRSNPTTGAVILTAQTIGTTYTATADDCQLVIVNRALTGQETTDLTAYLNGKAGL
jgi:hypothetical protein